MIYNPWFESRGINAIVAPFAVHVVDFPDVFKASLFCLWSRTWNGRSILQIAPSSSIRA
jgi:hypothetical protein